MPSAPRAPGSRRASGNHVANGSVTGDQRRTRAVNHRRPSGTPEFFAYAKLGRVTTASVAVEAGAMSICGRVSECWVHRFISFVSAPAAAARPGSYAR
jgi:hypothetical protein